MNTKVTNKLIIGLFILISWVMVTSVNAAGLQYLRMPVFSRSEGMAGAYTAIAMGPGAIFYNPAGPALAEQEDYYLAAGYTAWYEGINKESVVCLFPSNFLLKPFIRAVSIDYFSIGSLEKYDSYGNKTGKMRYYDVALNVNFGVKIHNLAVGSNIKYLSEYISGYEGSGYGMDLGVLYTDESLFAVSPILRIGCAISNIGNFTLDGAQVDLPRTFRAGAGVIWEGDPDVLVGVDWEKSEEGNYLHIGGELEHNGYFFRAGLKDTGGGYVYTAGVGVNSVAGDESSWGGQIKLNYSFMAGGSFDELVHRGDVGVSF